MKAPYDVVDPESGELLIEVGEEVDVEGFYALVDGMARDKVAESGQEGDGDVSLLSLDTSIGALEG